MRKDIVSMCGDFDKVRVLSVNPAPCPDFTDNSETMISRFLCLLNQLGAEGFLGLQVSSEQEAAGEVLVFSNGESNVTDEDYNWVFAKSAEVAGKSRTESLFGEGRRVYAIEYEPVEAGDAEMSIFVGNDAQPMNDSFGELVSELLREKAIIRLVSTNLFLFSLPEEIPLRLRSRISMSFPKNARYTEVFAVPESNASLCHISRNCFNRCLIHLWNELQSRAKERSKAEPPVPVSPIQSPDNMQYIPFEVIDKSRDTHIEKLELSVRSYNCLMRAGISTVGELMFMDDAALSRIRNLGGRGKDEVKQQLAEFLKKRSESQEDDPNEVIDCWEKLDSMIGLEDVKKQVRKIAAYARMKQDMASKGLMKQTISLHMQFVGNPGTAKTTVARLVAGILRDIGILSSGRLVEVGREDLVGKYEGQTAPKVKEVFERAKGNVLFIDEAYSLVEGWDGSYGDEAINTIVREMENNREDTVVIFAGYPDKMEELISRNPGLRSRVSFKLVFRDYSEEELVRIAGTMADEQGFKIGDDAEPALAKLCREAAGNSELGNGRFCRNLIEHAILDYAERVYSENNPFVDKDFVLLEEDFSSSIETEVPGRKCIGFHSAA